MTMKRNNRKMGQRIEEAAGRFLEALGAPPAVDHGWTVEPITALVTAAYRLYAESWGNDWDIRQWEWPLSTLHAGEQFDGNEPWAVLFRRAVALARTTTTLTR